MDTLAQKIINEILGDPLVDNEWCTIGSLI